MVVCVCVCECVCASDSDRLVFFFFLPPFVFLCLSLSSFVSFVCNGSGKTTTTCVARSLTRMCASPCLAFGETTNRYGQAAPICYPDCPLPPALVSHTGEVPWCSFTFFLLLPFIFLFCFVACDSLCAVQDICGAEQRLQPAMERGRHHGV